MKLLNNERGLLSVDYLFAFVMVFGFTLLLLAISISLSVVEIAQYISFSSARAYYAGHVNEDAQNQLGKEKLNQLLQHRAIKTLFRQTGLFEVESQAVGRHDNIWQDNKVGDANEYINLFQGTRLGLKIKMLDFRIPGLGSTSGDGQGFRARVASYLSREVTYQECHEFVRQRWSYIQEHVINGRWPQKIKAMYQPIVDNGC